MQKGGKIYEQWFSEISAISAKSGVRLFNYQNSKIGLDNTLFKDGMHLNKRGAMLFSKDLAIDIKRTYFEDSVLTANN